MAAAGDLRRPFTDREAVRADLARFDNAVVTAWNGPNEVGTFAEARAQLPPRHTLTCTYQRGYRGGDVRNCVIRNGGRTVALFWISPAP